MQTSAEAITPSTSSSFASFLASLGSRQEKADPWSEDGLANDVATLSYERALQTHTQHHGSPEADSGREIKLGSRPALPASNERTACSAPERDCALKRASITIRLSEEECVQIRQRAAESGLTVSAYLRSCTLEVETLRAQVKEALACLRKPSLVEPGAATPKPARRHHIWPFGRRTA